MMSCFRLIIDGRSRCKIRIEDIRLGQERIDTKASAKRAGIKYSERVRPIVSLQMRDQFVFKEGDEAVGAARIGMSFDFFGNEIA